MSAEHLRFSPDILRRLGEELIPHPYQGVLELVRNSFDADALHCRVELVETHRAGGTLRVTDDGNGMTIEAIRNGWLVLGRSAKAARQPTKLGRLPVGDKGLGRLAALRMGSFANLKTRPSEEPGREYRLKLDWLAFDQSDVIEDVDLEVITATTGQPPGTTIEVTALSVNLGRREVQNLARALLLLADPFDNTAGFRPELISPEFADLEHRVRDSYFNDAEFQLSARLDEHGRATAQVLDRTGKVRWEASHQELGRRRDEASLPYHTPPAEFDLWAFNVSSKGFASSVPLAELRPWLETVGGVHLYHRGLRVQPYGDPGHDWLEMNLARVRSPELRPSTNTSVGRIVLLDPQGKLTQKTDRSGFIEDDTFFELKRFAQDALRWMATRRLHDREAKRVGDRVAAPQAVSEARQGILQNIERLPSQQQASMRRAIERLETARDHEVRTLREDVLLYRTLGTVGTTAAIFAHESAKPVTQIEKMAKTVADRGAKLLGERYTEIERPINYILRAASALRSFATLFLRLLAREKRRTGRISVHQAIRDVADLFEPFLRDENIALRLELIEADPRIHGTIAEVEAILANLLTNSVNAINAGRTSVSSRTIIIRTEISGESLLLLRVLDSGCGIQGLPVAEIWLPGRTTWPSGTGLGLTIVRDTVADLGGQAHALARGELGGAELIVELPMVTEE